MCRSAWYTWALAECWFHLPPLPHSLNGQFSNIELHGRLSQLRVPQSRLYPVSVNRNTGLTAAYFYTNKLCMLLASHPYVFYHLFFWNVKTVLEHCGPSNGQLFPQCEDVFSLAPLVSDHVFARLFDTTARLDTQKLQQSAPSPHCRGPRYDFSEKYVFSAHLLLTDNTSKNDTLHVNFDNKIMFTFNLCLLNKQYKGIEI